MFFQRISWLKCVHLNVQMDFILCVYKNVFGHNLFNEVRSWMRFSFGKNMTMYALSYSVYELKLSLLHTFFFSLSLKIPTLHLTPITCYYHVSPRMHIFPTMLTSENNAKNKTYQRLCNGLWTRKDIKLFLFLSFFVALKYFSNA